MSIILEAGNLYLMQYQFRLDQYFLEGDIATAVGGLNFQVGPDQSSGYALSKPSSIFLLILGVAALLGKFLTVNTRRVIFFFAPVIISFIGLHSPIAKAALIDHGNFTEDSVTGLKWLDLAATMGYSVNDILGGTGGFWDAGYRHATVAEVYQLFEHGGIADFSPGISTGNNEAVIGLQSLLGITKKAKADGQFYSLGFHGLNEPHDGLVAGYAYQAQLYYQSLAARLSSIDLLHRKIELSEI